MTTPPYRLVVFDFDGTLADSFSWFMGAANRAAARFRFRPIEEHERETLRGYEARRVVDHLGLSPWKLPAVARHMRREMAREIDRIPLFPGVAGMLERLAGAGVAIAIVSSNAEENVRRVLGPGSTALVRHFGCGAAIFGKRPKLRAALRAAGVAPGEAICVGDEIRDLRAGRAEGMAVGAVAWGYTTGDALAAHAPDALFTRMEEMAERLAGGRPA